MPRAKTAAKVPAEVPKLDIRKCTIEIEGLEPGLISHRFSEKARQEIEEKQRGAAKRGRPPRDPEQESRDSLYELDHPRDGALFGFPAAGLKQAAVVAGGRYLGDKMTVLRGAFFIVAEADGLVPIRPPAGAPSPDLQEGGWKPSTHMARLKDGTASPTHRALFPGGWRATLVIEYNGNVVTEEQLRALIAAGGFSTGIGDWRPERDGEYGRWRVVE